MTQSKLQEPAIGGGKGPTSAPLTGTGSAGSELPGTALPALRAALSPLLLDGVRPALLLADVAGCAAAGLLTASPVTAVLVLTVAVVVLHATGGLYRSRLQLSLLDDLPSLLGRWMVASAALLTVVATSTELGARTAGFALVALGCMLVARTGCYAAVRWMRRIGLVTHSTLIVGTGAAGRRVAEILHHHPEYGLRPSGFLSTRSVATDELGAPVVGDPSHLSEILQRSETRVVVLAYAQVPDPVLVNLIRACHRSTCELFLVPRLYELHQVSDDMEMIWGVPLVRLRRSAGRSVSWQFKRLLDVLVAGTAALLLAPVLAACALAVRWEGGPGVIFRQTRVGMDGRPFELLKFRSLAPVDEHESGTRWNIANDDRLGPVGRFLRVSSLDELPQLWNILRGDMSMVGPRPERPQFVDQFALRYPGYIARHRVPSGLTGLAQVHGLRGDTDIDDRARFDNFYIENWSLWLDIKILLRTAVSVFTARGA
ncbi:sugar transferase [Nocardioides sp. Arc9.136]|uniref:sugar transferase n=1 Tax=Nocardioides sp. Arc9.136 TaxID=2996826 RepID=UPI0026654085|nr:sugar transferase [Nocardioides sp. Arc9.136]WKN48576.1 sugar transferase [Nocardioides sp. Arc9.136]